MYSSYQSVVKSKCGMYEIVEMGEFRENKSQKVYTRFKVIVNGDYTRLRPLMTFYVSTASDLSLILMEFLEDPVEFMNSHKNKCVLYTKTVVAERDSVKEN